MDGYQDEFFDGNLDRDYAIKKKNAISSPKSAHNPLKTKDVLLEYYQDSDEEDKEDFGQTPEEQRKGLWRSIFGYFRGAQNDPDIQKVDSKSQKDIQVDQYDLKDDGDEQLILGIQAEKDKDEEVKSQQEIVKPKTQSADNNLPKYEIDLRSGSRDSEEQGEGNYGSEYGSEMLYGDEF